MIIDTHQHFWKYNADEYGWISKGMEKIRRDFMPADLKKNIDRTDVTVVISVQARQKLEETNWLLSLASENDFISGVVGWFPLADPEIEAILERYSENKNLKGVRHVLQDEPDPYYMLRKDFNRGICLLPRFSLIYEILIYEHHLPQTITFVDKHPNQIFVLDHIAKPLIRENVLSPWKENITELARRENVFCKISGMVTEADHHHWNENQLKPYFEIVLDSFGPSRLMFGSDWPVCLLACGYEQWVEIIYRFIASLSPDEQKQIWEENARNVYNL